MNEVEKELLICEMVGVLEKLETEIEYTSAHLCTLDLLKLKTKTAKWKQMIDRIETKTDEYLNTLELLPDELSEPF